MLTGIERLVVVGNDFVDIYAGSETVAAGATFEVDGSGASTGFSFGGYDETDGCFDITGGSGFGETGGGQLADTITMSAHTDTYRISGFGGGDRITCNTGEDRVQYWAAADSTGIAGHDTVRAFDADVDKFDLTVTLTGGFSATPVSTTVNTATFDADIGSVSNGAIGPNGGWIVNASGGDLIGHDFLCIDTNGNNFYNVGTDYVIDITGYTGTLDAADFI